MKNTISLTKTQKGIQTLQINAKRFNAPIGMPFDIPQKLIEKINISEFPVGIILKPYLKEALNNYCYNSMPIMIENLGNGNAKLEIEACKNIEEPLFPISIGHFQLIKMEYIMNQYSYKPDISIFNIDSTVVHLHFTIEVPSNSIKKLILAGMDFDKTVTVPILNEMKSIVNSMRTQLGLSLLK